MLDLCKTSVAARRLTPLASWLCVVLLLAACGQKGPLTLPAAGATASAPATAPAR